MSKQVYNMLQHVLSLSNMTSSVKHSELFSESTNQNKQTTRDSQTAVLGVNSKYSDIKAWFKTEQPLYIHDFI